MMPTSKKSPQKAPDSCLELADRLGLDVAAAKGNNFVFSPLSILAALSIAAAGSNGDTLVEFLSFLGSETIGDANSAAQALLEAVRPIASSVPHHNHSMYGYDCTPERSHVSLVNSVWVEQTFALKPSFKETAASLYNAEVGNADFMNTAREEGERINEWVGRKTNGLIKDLIPVGGLNASTSLIIVNALHFKGHWLSEFTTTRDQDFRLLDGTTTVRAPLMSNGKDHYIALFHGFRVLKLHYTPDEARRKFSMLILLPDEVDGLAGLVKYAVSDPGFFDRHTPTELVKTGRFGVPKFKISCAFEPSGVLKEMGLRAAFDKYEARFEEMAHIPDPFRLYISAVLHRATIEVDEKGTEAAAATAVVVSSLALGCSMHFQPRVDFVADHPFMFVIREDSGAVLFLGHVVYPLL